MLTDNLSTLGLGIAALLVVRIIASWLKKPNYLPGPSRLPFIGNVLQMPESEAWVQYKKWGEQYGWY